MALLYGVEITDTPADHASKWGGPNEFPPGWEEIDEKTFVQDTYFGTYTPERMEYRNTMYKPFGQDVRYGPGVKGINATLLFFHDGSGVAIEPVYWGVGYQANKPPAEGYRHMRFYRFGCRHQYRELSRDECRTRGLFHAGNCYHVSECQKCHYILSYDSGD